ncbi:MAG: hypothetical protein GKR88_19055 [Flavobacteriaceae bacterium]|nr:MAG: hypothetical protein GKR88_18985 [Flavobacteriaceae bacterium]QMU66164.1 MAG: hypothetical protein GKR88_19055 [Flavobacteriaceae bacterium]
MRNIIIILLSILFLSCGNKSQQKQSKEQKPLTRIDTVRFENTYYLGTGFVKDDFITFYTKDGFKRFEGALKEGKLNGIVYYFGKQGNIEGSLNYEFGHQKGIGVTYDIESGFAKTILKIDEDGGTKNGLVMKFNKNGTLNYLKDHSSDELYIQTVKFYENGVIKQINSRKRDSIYSPKLDGWSFLFDEKGRISEKILYSNGEIVEEYKINSTSN